MRPRSIPPTILPFDGAASLCHQACDIAAVGFRADRSRAIVVTISRLHHGFRSYLPLRRLFSPAMAQSQHILTLLNWHGHPSDPFQGGFCSGRDEDDLRLYLSQPRPRAAGPALRAALTDVASLLWGGAQGPNRVELCCRTPYADACASWTVGLPGRPPPFELILRFNALAALLSRLGALDGWTHGHSGQILPRRLALPLVPASAQERLDAWLRLDRGRGLWALGREGRDSLLALCSPDGPSR